MDPRSRFFDPYDQDEPPMPPDDPISHELMLEVDGKKGFQVQLRCTGYRGIPLWSVQKVTLKVDGKDINPKDMLFILDGARYKVEELKNQ
jgi:hypothetical protein